MQYKSPLSSTWLCAASLHIALGESFHSFSQKILYTLQRILCFGHTAGFI
jgi:hypothetical protein